MKLNENDEDLEEDMDCQELMNQIVTNPSTALRDRAEKQCGVHVGSKLGGMIPILGKMGNFGESLGNLFKGFGEEDEQMVMD